MSAPQAPSRITVNEALARIPSRGVRHVRVLSRGDLELQIYAPQDRDDQTPHDRDEMYVVSAGEGMFRNGPSIVPFGPGDVLLVPAGVEHRFESFSNDLAVWVIFFGPKGGCAPKG